MISVIGKGAAIGALVGLTLLVFAATPLAAAEPVYGRLWVKVKVADNALEDTPAMASAVRPDGALLDQGEGLLVKAPNWQSILLERLPGGVLDVRVEAEGVVTEVKKGVHIFTDRDNDVTFVVRPGQGVHIVEYAVAGLSREEVAARLGKLESETARLGAELAGLKPATPGG